MVRNANLVPTLPLLGHVRKSHETAALAIDNMYYPIQRLIAIPLLITGMLTFNKRALNVLEERI